MKVINLADYHKFSQEKMKKNNEQNQCRYKQKDISEKMTRKKYIHNNPS